MEEIYKLTKKELEKIIVDSCSMGMKIQRTINDTYAIPLTRINEHKNKIFNMFVKTNLLENEIAVKCQGCEDDGNSNNPYNLCKTCNQTFEQNFKLNEGYEWLYKPDEETDKEKLIYKKYLIKNGKYKI